MCFLFFLLQVAKHWPEFARNGKENVLIESILRHESGLSKIQQEN